MYIKPSNESTFYLGDPYRNMNRVPQKIYAVKRVDNSKEVRRCQDIDNLAELRKAFGM